MRHPKKVAVVLFSAVLILVAFQHAVLGAAASIQKSVVPMEDGKFLVKIRVKATESSIYALKITDPKASILDVYAPRGWCIVADEGDFLARSFKEPIQTNKSIEFIIHSSTDDIQYTWSVFGKMKQLGTPGTL